MQFAKELGEFANLDDVRKRIREGMEAERKHEAEREAKDKLVAELVKRNDFEVPGGAWWSGKSICDWIVDCARWRRRA